MNSYTKTKIALLTTVWTFSLFASTLSTFIMQAIHYYGVSKTSAGTLESYQNISMVIFTFFAFSYFLKFGYRKSLISISALMTVICLVIPFVNQYWMIKLYLICIGIVFVGMKVGIYSTVSLASRSETDQAMLLTILELTWAIATLISMRVIAYFLGHHKDSWLFFTWVFAGFGVLNIIVWCFVKLDESALKSEKLKSISNQIKDILNISKNKIVLAAIGILFLCNFVEMGITSWLPGFYEDALAIDPSLSVKIASYYILSTFAGRIVVLFLLKFMSWSRILFFYYLIGFIYLAAILLLLKPAGQPITAMGQVPILAFLLSFIGFFIAPNTPLLNSSILSRTEQAKQSLLMTVLTIVFAISSSLAARIIGQLMDHLGDILGFKLATLIPFILLVLFIIPYARFIKQGRVK